MHPDDDPTLARRRRQKREREHRRRLLLLGGLVLVLAGVAWVAVAAAVKRSRDSDDGRGGPPLLGGPSAASEGETWSHKELAAYLRSRGLHVIAEHTHHGAMAGPANYFFGTGTARVYVQKQRSAQDAKDTAGAIGDRTFSWGRFYFRGDPDDAEDAAYMAGMKTALGVP